VAGLSAFVSFPAGRQDAAGYGRQDACRYGLALVSKLFIRERIYEMERAVSAAARGERSLLPPERGILL
jgi:hypothetical protein